MKAIWILALNDLKLTARDRPSFVWMIAMPIVMMWFFGNMGGGGSGTPRITLSLIDQDGGWIAKALIEELTDETLDIREIDPSTPAGDSARIRTLVVPAGFTDGVTAGEQQTLRLEKDPNSNAEYGIAAEVHITRAIVRTLGRLVEMNGAGGLQTVAGITALDHFRDLGERPDLVSLSVSTAGSGQAVPSGRAQSVPGIMTFVVMMMTLIYGGVFLTNEKLSGMLRRQAQLPMTRRELFVGKLLGRLLMAGLQVVILVIVGRVLFGISWGNSPVGLALVLTSYVIAIGALSTLMGALLDTPAQASSVGWIVSMVMAALGGCWWPGEVMPPWMQTVALALPTAWAMKAFHALISFGYGVSEVLIPSLVLLGFGLLFTWLGSRYLRFEA